ncbi:MAG: UvrD-helicase domain-containing protein [Acidobacteria bacterium]|nr:UvrD-helicase domain-containing protein [Acidobacteriota bacterium]
MSDEATLRAQDCRARLAAQTVFNRPVVLEAGAGTGKTAALVARIVAWSLGSGWEAAEEERPGDDDRIAAAVLDGVVAITFTEDAAAEMAQRVAEVLARLESDGEDGGSDVEKADCAGSPQLLPGLFRQALPADLELIRERARALLAQLERLRVSTIHAFARSLLARFPVEAGVHPSFEVDADGSASEELVSRAVEEVLAQEYGREAGDGLALAELGIGPIQLSDAVRALVEGGVPRAALVHDPFTEEGVAQLLADLRGLLVEANDGLRVLAAEGRSSRAKETAGLLLELRELSEQPASAAISSLVRTREWLDTRFDRLHRKQLQRWATGEFGKKPPQSLDTDAFQAVAADLRPMLDHLSGLAPETFNRLRRVLAAVLECVEAEKRRRGVVVFQDLLVLARRLLAEHPEVCREVQLGVDQLLVDEMQDTDREQAGIIRRLALEGPGESLPGLFLVGDPKQSIYGWRSADLAVYEELIGSVLAAGGERHALLVSFRSVGAVLDEVERCAGPVMVEAPGVQPPFEPLLPCAAKVDDPGYVDQRRRPVEHWVSVAADETGTPVKTDATAAADLEADAVARDMAELAAAGVPRREMAVLMRTRTHLESYLRALRRYGVPYEVGRDASYFRTREVIEAAALVRLVLDPFDHLALATVLRSPMVGVPDAALVPLWRAGLPRLVSRVAGVDPDLMAEIGNAVETAERDVPQLPELDPLSGWPQALLTALGAVAELRAAFRRDSSDVFVELLRTSTLIEPLAAARFPGAYRLANLERFFRGLEATLGEGATPEGVLRRLRLAVRERRDEETGRPRESASDAVSVLTVHGAKGLGFRHVWLVQTHAGRTERREPARTAAGQVDDRWELELIGFRTPGYVGLEQRQQRVADAEEVRTLYVALTRAKERLVTLGNWRPPRGSSRSYLGLLELRSGGRPTLEDLWSEAGRSGAAWHDTLGARWVLPGYPGWAGEAATVAVQSATPRQPAPAKISSDARRLQLLRARAAARMARSWSSRASEEAHRELAELIAAAGTDDQSPSGEPTPVRRHTTAQRTVAVAVGSAAHRVLERVDPAAADPESELEQWRREADAWLESVLPDADQLEEARSRLAELLTSFSNSVLGQRFRELAPGFVARELPVLLAPAGDEGAVGYLSGTIDLVYRDPQDGRLVVADYKTDEVTEDEQIEARSDAYAEQLAVYVRALREAVGLDQPPRAELWFLAAGRVVPVG